MRQSWWKFQLCATLDQSIRANILFPHLKMGLQTGRIHGRKVTNFDGFKTIE